MHDGTPTPADSAAARWRPLGWLVLLLAGWAVYELTQSPALGTVLICCKFGWDDLATAHWLWRRDPLPARRRACVWLYAARGLWQIAAVAFLMGFALSVLTPPNALPQAPGPAVLVLLGTWLTSLIGFALSAVLTALAVYHAWRGGVRLWLDSAVHRARRHDFWPPTPFCYGRANRLASLVLTACFVALFVVLLTLLVALNPHMAGLLLVALSILAPVLLIGARELLCARIGAEAPAECWPEEWDPELQWQPDPPLQ